MQKKLFLILFGMIALISFTTSQTFGEEFKGLDRKTCIGIPDVFKPLFITYMDIKDKDVAKTLLDNLASIIFKDSYFMPQLICLINKHLDENDKEILNYCGFENNSKIYYKSCGLLEDELNQY